MLYIARFCKLITFCSDVTIVKHHKTGHTQDRTHGRESGHRARSGLMRPNRAQTGLIKYLTQEKMSQLLLGILRANMGRTRRNCPVFGCGSTNLSRLANHLDQVHDMSTEECKKWLKWSKIGICVPQHSEEPSGLNMKESLENLFQRQEEMERHFNIYLRDVQTRKRETSKSKGIKRKNKWLTS